MSFHLWRNPGISQSDIDSVVTYQYLHLKIQDMLRKILIGLLIVLIIGQFIQPPHNSDSPVTANYITHSVPVPDSVMALLKVACYDCHSNSTRYPWYSRITPVNWWLYNHIQEGKHHLNFSEFTGSYKRKMRRLEETAEMTEKHEMPIGSYLWIHKDARLSDAQRKLIIDWANNARQQLLQDSIRKASII
jgi:hypothetical protein